MTSPGQCGEASAQPALRGVASALGVAALAALACGAYGLLEAPIHWDRAYFTVLAQTALRGDSVYAVSFLGYPPLGPLVSAATMAVGSLFDVPTFLAPRFAAVAAVAASAALICIVARRATGSPAAGLVAGIALAGFAPLARSSVSTLEPKHLVMLFAVLATAATQTRRFGWAGFLAICAASTWQPAALLPVALLPSVLAGGHARRARRFGAFCAGGLLGALPALVYLGAHDAWILLFERAVSIPLSGDLANAGASPWKWLRVCWREYPHERWLFVFAAVGFAAFTASSFGGGGRRALTAWTDPRLGGLPLQTLAFGAWSSVDVGHHPDLFVLLPAVAFWLAWGIRAGIRRVAHARAALALTAMALAVVLVYAHRDRPAGVHRQTLSDQRALVAEILALAPDRGAVLAFSAEEIYALGELVPPAPYLRLSRSFMPFLDSVEPGGCSGLVERLRREPPALVAVKIWRRSSACERRLGAVLRARGYVEHRFRSRGALEVYVRPPDQGR